MTHTDSARDAFLATFRQSEPLLNRNGSGWVHSLRTAALERFVQLGFPTTHQEEWRFTNVAPLTATQFAAAPDCSGDVDENLIASLAFHDADCLRIVFVNGHFAERLSSADPLPPGVRIGNLADALHDHRDLVEPCLARHAGYDDQTFTALNTAFLGDGGFVHVADGVEMARPVHFVYITTDAAVPVVTHPRNLVVVGQGSRATVIESYVGMADNVYFTNPVTEIQAGAGSHVEAYKLTEEGAAAFHVGALAVHQEAGSQLVSNVSTFGGRLVRHDVTVALDGEGCTSSVNGLYLLADEQHVDNHTRIEHLQPHCTSREVFKGILDDRSHAVFTGRIYVHPGAQKTDGVQHNQNLLLSDNAVANSQPQLEIYADDVKCTHGGTVGQIEESALFYLRARGIPAAVAHTLLTYAFAQDVIAEVPWESLRAYLEDRLLNKLPQGERIRELR